MAGTPHPNVVQPTEAQRVDSVAVAFDEVSLAFDDNVVLDRVSFELRTGRMAIFLGASGAGKSTVLRLVLGLLKPDAGRVFINGRRIDDMSERDLMHVRAEIGMVFQEGALFDSLTVRDNVAYQLIQENVPDDAIDARVHEALRFVELDQTFSLFPGSLSGGMRRRVAIARALIRQPELVLYDSPTGGLDPITSTTIIELVMKERDVYSTPSILVTHRLQDAFTLCTHRFDSEQGHMVPLPKGHADPNTTFLMLEEGRLIFDGSLHDIIHTDNKFVREFLL
jgi:phospholipid/cholesterol/gamma-HCH transport system ATP-binding protein